ncbi:amylo-alpha-1,6-glucosidase [Oricola thermophila]|uniref:Amylo-alpha-1,6-glucosidase n=1 Tax=Oricola thermophila TaxID=2742145 RepID=A0A6N1VIY4_9HYPH|nr:amylo-alpha-1,6-glucosidase [Oricola thermophila]QKV19159.1 amylo-alpha-1,6-glucosidase [Oricola thermophila]
MTSNLQRSKTTQLHGGYDGSEPPLAPPLDASPRILKHGDMFALLNAHGDVEPTDLMGAGIYMRDTRRLSRMRLTLAGEALLLLSSHVTLETGALIADLANPDIWRDGDKILPRDTLHVYRTKYLWEGSCHERIAVRSFDLNAIETDLDLSFDVDFADIFEARGYERAQRGDVAVSVEGGDTVTFTYASADGERRVTRLRFWPRPTEIAERRARWRLDLPARGSRTVFVDLQCDPQAEAKVPPRRFFSQMRHACRSIMAQTHRGAQVETSDELVNQVFSRSRADITMLTTETAQGAYPFAGVPWFSTPFGRDGIITAWLMLWADPHIARGVLRYLAAAQASSDDPASDAEPGKILHESRDGELANLGLVPFRRYYGSVDSTPLFVALAGAYWRRTGNADVIHEIWPAVSRALDWIERDGDRDRDGFVEYFRRRPDGLVNQGWKDSSDSTFHADGRLAEGPIALVEVQGYVYDALRSGSVLARIMGEHERADRLASRANELLERIDRAFWQDEMGFYAMALDGEKRPCAVRGSNVGHLLFSGAARPARVGEVVRAMMSPTFFSGYGIRTVATTEARYNPMSYHNGSVWPHDTALAALGMARYGHTDDAARLFGAILDAASTMDLQRLPELFCGFRRRRGVAPTLYPVACSPQAWAAAAPFGMLAASLGLEVDARARTVRLTRPHLPERLERVMVRRIPVGDGTADIYITRAAGSVAIDVPHRSRGVEIDVKM